MYLLLRRSLLIFFLCHQMVSAQESYKLYMVTFPDKGNIAKRSVPTFSDKALQRRLKNGVNTPDSLDYPVYEPYVDSLRSKSFEVMYTSRWLNAALLSVKNNERKPEISLLGKQLPVKYIGKYEPVQKLVEEPESSEKPSVPVSSNLKDLYGSSYAWLNALHAAQLKQAGFNGKGVTIAVLDAGFAGIPRHRAFKNTNIIYTYDWVDREHQVYNDDSHGSEVLSCMAASDSGQLIGMSAGAQYILMRTENARQEFEYEEFCWTLAAEYADSVGADFICSSLGYNYFDDGDSHTFESLDGKTTLVAIAAGIAARKGIWVFVSAGNEGNDPWKRITTPADAFGVTVTGATTFSGDETYFSSAGPTADHRPAPQLGAPGSGIYTVQSNTTDGYTYKNGSSYSNPMVCGLAASLMEKYPQVPYRKLQESLYRSALHYPDADPYKGYGWPSFDDIDTNTEASKAPIFVHLQGIIGDTVILEIRAKDHTRGRLQICGGKKLKVRESTAIQQETGGNIMLRVINRKQDMRWVIRFKAPGQPVRLLPEILLENKTDSP